MFGDMMGMMGKLKETQEKVEATKKRMDTVLIDENSSDSLLEDYRYRQPQDQENRHCR